MTVLKLPKKVSKSALTNYDLFLKVDELADARPSRSHPSCKPKLSEIIAYLHMLDFEEE
jgi:hypothetical protein